MKSLFHCFAVAIFVFYNSTSFAQNSFQGVGDLAGGKYESWVWDVSANGAVVVGHSYYNATGVSDQYQAFRWTESTKMVGIGFLPGGDLSVAEAVSEDGSAIVGWATSSNFSGKNEAFRWVDSGSMTGLGGLSGTQATSSTAYGVAANGGVIAGVNVANNSDEQAFFYLVPFGMTGIGFLPRASGSTANDICYRRSDAVIVGASGGTAFYFITPGPMVGIGVLSGYETSAAEAISGNGDVIVGTCGKYAGEIWQKGEAFRYFISSGTMEGLGELDIDGSDASDVSGDGSVIVGVSGGGPFIWDAANGMRDLRTVMENEYRLDLTGWILVDAQAISDDGTTIVGNGINPDGKKEGWVAKLVTKGGWLKVIDPNGGETLAGNSQYEIKWTSSGFIVPTNIVNILYSTDGFHPSAWGIIAQNTVDDGSFMWTVPNISYSNCVIQIVNAVNGQIKDFSDTTFTITAAPVLTLIQPNGGENLQPGSTYNITWTSENIFDNDVTIEFSSDNGANYQFVDFHTNNEPSKSYAWEVPDVNSSTCLIRISLEIQSQLISDVSDNTFTIEPLTQSITITAPNGGENWQVGSSHNVNWTNQNFSDPVTVEYSIDGGASYSTIIDPVMNSGSYSWTIPNTPSTDCRLRVSDSNDGNPADASDASFTISAPENTMQGKDVTVDVGNGVTVTFDNVTTDGNTTLDVKYSGPPPPSGFKLIPSSLPVYFDINTTASFNGDITICIPYDDTGMTPEEEANLTLHVYETPPGNWVDITIPPVDVTSNIICGKVNHLTDFAIMLGPVHFSYTSNTGESYSIVIDNATLDGNTLETNDEIGVFTPGGLCVGASVWDGNTPLALTAWADDSQTDVVDGYSNGDKMYFKIWDASSGTSDDYSAIPTYLTGNGNFGDGTYARISTLAANNTSITQAIALLQGWSWISLNVLPADLSLQSIMANVDNLVIVVNGAGNFYIPNVINNIGQINVLEGYKIYVTSSGQLSVTGRPVDVTTPIDLVTGWNFISYLPENPMPVETALASILSEVVIIKNDEGNFFIPDLMNTLGNMIPGEGYKLYLQSDKTLKYPQNNNVIKNSSTTPYVKNVRPQHFQFRARTGDYHCLVIQSINIENNTLKIGDEVGVFTASGLCVGAGVWNTSGIMAIAAWVDDDQTDEKDGYVGNEEINYRYWDSITKTEMKLTPIYTIGNDKFGNGEYSVVNLNNTSLAKSYILDQNYPNPFNSSTVITFHLPQAEKIELTVYNLVGEEIRKLLAEEKNAGVHKAYWDGRNKFGETVPSGVYIYQLKTGNRSTIKKAVFVK